MDTNISTGITVQILIALVGIIGSGLAVFVGLKVALAESQKDIKHIMARLDKHDVLFERHVDPSTHPTREQVGNLKDQITNFTTDVRTTSARIERKVDKIIENWGRSLHSTDD